MENQDILDQYAQNATNSSLSSEAVNALQGSAKWARLLAIVGFVMCGFVLLAAVFVMTLSSQFIESGLGASFGIFAGLLYVGLAALLYFPYRFLYRFAKSAKIADTSSVTVAMENLYKYFRFFGIMTVIVLGIYAVVLLFAILGGGMALMSGGFSR
jgi:hypothetical protein